jgi:predicted phosphodiesterase
MRTALVADIHGNSPALRAVLADVARHGCGRLLVLGDIVNGLDPAGCVDMLREAWPGLRGIRGNAEQYLLTPRLEAFPLRDDPRYAEVIRLAAWWRARLGPARMAWLAALPDVLIEEGMCLVHDTPLDRLFPERWWRPDVAPEYQEFCYHSPGLPPGQTEAQLGPLLDWMAGAGVSDVFCGHTHEAFSAELRGRRITNAGSAGLPLDGDPRAAWALVEEGAGGRRVEIRRVAYDLGEAEALLEATPDYPSAADSGRRESYRQMLLRARHWRSFGGDR